MKRRAEQSFVLLPAGLAGVAAAQDEYEAAVVSKGTVL
jgi:hypothetical protein